MRILILLAMCGCQSVGVATSERALRVSGESARYSTWIEAREYGGAYAGLERRHAWEWGGFVAGGISMGRDRWTQDNYGNELRWAAIESSPYAAIGYEWESMRLSFDSDERLLVGLYYDF